MKNFKKGSSTQFFSYFKKIGFYYNLCCFVRDSDEERLYCGCKQK